jgi:hypothetical protein
VCDDRDYLAVMTTIPHALVAATVTATVRWLARVVLPQLEERYTGAEERWRALKDNLARYGADKE